MSNFFEVGKLYVCKNPKYHCEDCFIITEVVKTVVTSACRFDKTQHQRARVRVVSNNGLKNPYFGLRVFVNMI